ncbi:spore coat U domain-containing protein [Pseudomonas mendocina]|nr:spore coat U domain-containing protein [Pseudomonas mendocina]MBH3341747.1 spore coat U domain-containing protein [Pseudomonas mendocina]
MIRWVAFALLLCSALASTTAHACNTYGASVNLGTTNSLSLRTNPQFAAAGAGLSCPGVLQLLTAAYVRVTLQNAGSLVLRDGQGNQIPFQVYQDSGYNQALVAGQPQQLGAINLLALGGSSSAIGLYFRTNPGPNVPAGTYTATVTLRWDWAICTIGLINLCNWSRSPGVTQSCPLLICTAPTNWGTGSLATLTITLVVSKACRIDTLPNVDFGAQALISQFSTQQRTFAVTCTATEGYTLTFDNGQNYQAPWRRLRSGSNYIRYNLYHNASSLIWNPASPLTASGTGNSQTFTYQAILDPGQPNAPVGVYTDNVLLIINY